MTNKEFELIGQLTEVAMTVAELKAENKILKDINEKLMKALRIHDVSGSLPCHHNYIQKDTYWKSCTHCGMLAPLGQ